MTILSKEPMNILLVEDGIVDRKYLGKHLSEPGHEATSYAGAETALDAYHQAFHPLIILDLGLPGMVIIAFRQSNGP